MSCPAVNATFNGVAWWLLALVVPAALPSIDMKKLVRKIKDNLTAKHASTVVPETKPDVKPAVGAVKRERGSVDDGQDKGGSSREFCYRWKTVG